MKSSVSHFLLIIINYYSAIYVVSGVVIPYVLEYSLSSVLYFAMFWVYLFPPLLCYALITLFGRPRGTVESGSSVFLYWWFLTQLQIIFVRFSFLEELLRIFPGVYNIWLNMWGAKVSLLTYWSPGVTVTDRYDINIGRCTILGGGCRIGAHLISLSKNDEQYQGQCLTLAPVVIEENCVIGFHAAIGPGSHVYANETVPAGKILKPFYMWKGGSVKRPIKDF